MGEKLSQVVGVTNTLIATNTIVTTNTTTNSFSGTFLLSRTNISWWTSHYLAYFPVLCISNEPSLRRGVEKITFVKTAYDSLLGRFYAPQTSFFTMTLVTNNANWVQTYERVASVPDFLFTAADLAPGPAAPPFIYSEVTRTPPIFNVANVLPGLAGPGIINGPTTLTFNKAGPLYYNTVTTNNLWFLDERTAVRQVLWASYDASTNPPVIYPNGTSIAAIESQMLMQVTSVSLPAAHRGVAYSTQLTGTGGVQPYHWALAPNSTAVPSGLALTLEGVLSGTPTATGVYSFFVQMTGADGGFTVWQVAITVLP